jgi:hypothetical protein
LRESSNQIPMRLDEVHREIRRLATMLNETMNKLNNSKEFTDITEPTLERTEQRRKFRNMKKCLETAADITTKASSTYDTDHQDAKTEITDLRELFKEEGTSMTDDWVKQVQAASLDDTSASRPTTSITDESHSAEDWDSDDEDDEIIEALYNGALKMLKEDNEQKAIRSLHNCVDRIDNHAGLHKLRPHIAEIRLSSLITLITIAREQEDWDTAQKRLRQKITILTSRSHLEADTKVIIDDTVLLSEVLLSKKDYVQSLGYGRSALKMIKKRKPVNEDECRAVLDLLVRICVYGDMQAEADGYKALLNYKFSAVSTPMTPRHSSLEDITKQSFTKKLEKSEALYNEKQAELESTQARQKKEVADLRNSHEDKVRALRKEIEEACSKSSLEKKIVLDKLASVELEKSKEIERLKCNYGALITTMTNDMNKMTNENDRLETKYEAKLVKLEDELDKRTGEYKAKFKCLSKKNGRLEQENKKLQDDMVLFKKELDINKSEYEARLRDLETKHSAELRTKDNKFELTMSGIHVSKSDMAQAAQAEQDGMNDWTDHYPAELPIQDFEQIKDSGIMEEGGKILHGQRTVGFFERIGVLKYVVGS